MEYICKVIQKTWKRRKRVEGWNLIGRQCGWVEINKSVGKFRILPGEGGYKAVHPRQVHPPAHWDPGHPRAMGIGCFQDYDESTVSRAPSLRGSSLSQMHFSQLQTKCVDLKFQSKACGISLVHLPDAHEFRQNSGQIWRGASISHSLKRTSPPVITSHLNFSPLDSRFTPLAEQPRLNALWFLSPFMRAGYLVHPGCPGTFGVIWFGVTLSPIPTSSSSCSSSSSASWIAYHVQTS